MKEYGPEGQPMAEYYWANGQVNSRKMFGFHGQKTVGWPGNIRTRGGLLYYNYDASGNAIGVDDRVGDTVMNYRYDAFGNLFTDMPAPYNATGYTGKTYDPVAGLMDYSARWYSPTVGRFLTEDSYMGNLNNPQSLNRYSYVMNNPVNMVDPSGHEPVPSWVRNKQSITIPYDQGGTSYFDNWNYVEGSYQKQTSPTVLVDTTYTNKFIQQTYQQMVTESWQYNYSKWFLFDDLILKRLPQYDYTKTFSEVSFLQWDHIITAKELMEQNADEIASYGAPPNARIVSSSSWLNGQPFSSDMIYGGMHAAQQYNEMLRKLREHTEPQEIQASGAYCQFGACHIGANGNMVMGAPHVKPPGSPLGIIHGILDIVGFIPVAGTFSEGINGIIYYAQGDYANASLSGLSMIPGIGDFAVAGKYIYKGAKLAKGATHLAADAEKISTKTSEELLSDSVESAAKDTPKLTKPAAGDNIGVNLRLKGTDKISGTHRELTSQKVKDSHHIIQDAAVRDLPLYNRNEAPAIHLQGPNIKGTEHYIAGQVQRQPGGGTYAAERRIGYKAMRRAGVSEEQARREIERVDQYFSSIGVTPDTVTRIPGNRRR